MCFHVFTICLSSLPPPILCLCLLPSLEHIFIDCWGRHFIPMCMYAAFSRFLCCGFIYMPFSHALCRHFVDSLPHPCWCVQFPLSPPTCVFVLQTLCLFFIPAICGFVVSCPQFSILLYIFLFFLKGLLAFSLPFLPSLL